MLNYKIDVLAALKLNGYSTTFIRKNKLLGESTLQRIRIGDTNISSRSISLICCMLNCQPSDFLENVITDEEKIQLFLQKNDKNILTYTLKGVIMCLS